MKVYRVEDSAGRGPYVSSCPYPKYHADFPNSQVGDQPCPWNDGISDAAFDPGKYMEDHGDPRVCAFKNLEQLVAWFGVPDVEALQACGGQISVIEVDPAEVKFGTQQITIPRHARRVGTIDSTETLLRKINSQRLFAVAQAADENHEKRFGMKSGYIVSNAKRASAVINEWLARRA